MFFLLFVFFFTSNDFRASESYPLHPPLFLRLHRPIRLHQPLGRKLLTTCHASNECSCPAACKRASWQYMRFFGEAR